MGTVMMHAAVSVDGFVADENDQVGPLFDYLGNGDAEIIAGGEIKVSQVSADYLMKQLAEDVSGAVIAGSGHSVAEEKPEELLEQLCALFARACPTGGDGR